MKIHEYQGKQLLKKFGVTVRAGFTARPSMTRSRQQKPWAARFGSSKPRFTPVAVARVAASRSQPPGKVREYASQILGMQLITHQTGRKARRFVTC